MVTRLLPYPRYSEPTWWVFFDCGHSRKWFRPGYPVGMRGLCHVCTARRRRTGKEPPAAVSRVVRALPESWVDDGSPLGSL